MTLDGTATFFAGALRAAGFGAAFLALTAGLALVVPLAGAFFAERALAALRADAFVAEALVALGFDGDFAFTARFVALFAAGLAFERDVDRLKPFVRLLLMGGISKGCSPEVSSRRNPRSLTHTPL